MKSNLCVDESVEFNIKTAILRVTFRLWALWCIFHEQHKLSITMHLSRALAEATEDGLAVLYL